MRPHLSPICWGRSGSRTASEATSGGRAGGQVVGWPSGRPTFTVVSKKAAFMPPSHGVEGTFPTRAPLPAAGGEQVTGSWGQAAPGALGGHRPLSTGPSIARDGTSCAILCRSQRRRCPCRPGPDRSLPGPEPWDLPAGLKSMGTDGPPCRQEAAELAPPPQTAGTELTRAALCPLSGLGTSSCGPQCGGRGEGRS